ncbi:ExeM/NucH family extracellular endonuclease [Shewanella marina]|uniref:ExeM/NucH family extracellular endonuclease n=1 Tax=Shewanella marina TaxID=487319 RepID=UPI0006862C6E|nr:ExeM/NucH family extracellular endonuclease [Shewanella marina]
MKTSYQLSAIAGAISTIFATSALAAPQVAVFDCNAADLTPIYAVQGDSYKSPMVGQTKTIRGIVTAKNESLFKGFYLQDAQGDANPATSDGIFVYTDKLATDNIKLGVEVCLQGQVDEFYSLTQMKLASSADYQVLDQATELAATPIVVNEGETLAQALERYEGMKVVLDHNNELVITRSFSYDYGGKRNNMVVSHQAPLMNPTQLHPVLSEAAIAAKKFNNDNQLFIETDAKPDNGEVPYYADFNAQDGYLRIGDKLVNFEGVIGYSYGKYRFVATNNISKADIISGNDRTDAPAIANKGDIRVASFNVLNLFNDAVGGDKNPLESNRGAKTAEEYQLQKTKIVNAIIAMNADIVGLMEIANNGYGENSAIADLVRTLNAELPAEQTYQFVEISDADKYKDKFIGSDAIAVGMLYRSAKVKLAGAAQVIAMPEQHVVAGQITRTLDGVTETNPEAIDKYQRHSLAQSFSYNDQPLTVVVNHFKSKGSQCAEDWLDDGDDADMQGSCPQFRVSAAKVLGDALKDVVGDVLIIGDTNSYAMEDPMMVLTGDDLTQSSRKIYSASWTSIGGTSYEHKAV